MRLRLNWLFLIIIYLSVNGQVFATVIHICPEMALTSTVLSTSQNAVNIHEHNQKSIHIEDGELRSMTHDMSKSKTMDNCQCVDCDCEQNISGQTNSSLLQNTDIADYFPIISTVLANLNRDFRSQPQSNPYRPPITN